MGLLSFLFGCKNDNGQKINLLTDSDTTKIILEEITAHIDTAEGWNDIFLKIVSDKQTDSSHVYIGKGLYKGKTVGLQCEVKKGIAAGLIQSGEINKNAFVSNGVKLTSIGQESNDLVKSLSELYQFPTTKPFTMQTITTTAFSLNQNKVDLNIKDYYKFKLFFEENTEDLYSELFFNIDLTRQIIELHEKDEEYRENIIKVLTK